MVAVGVSVGVALGAAVIVKVGTGVRDGKSAIAVGSSVAVVVWVGTNVGVTCGNPLPQAAIMLTNTPMTIA